VLVRSLVTFDFHNTLATCDPWFFLEIRDLAADVLHDVDPVALAAIGRDEVLAHYRALRKQVIASGVEIDAVASVEQVFGALGIAPDQDAIARSVERLMRETMSHVAPVPGAIETVREVAASDAAVGMVSSAVYHPFLEWTLAHFGIADHLDFVISSASCGYYKSSPEIYRQAMVTAGATPERSIHVGDSLRWDVWGAQQAGMGTIWFQHGRVDAFTHAAEPAMPDLAVDTMAGLAPLILDRLGLATV
jgi:HAD superfamily hydrolase (TIGR01509 family)